MTRSSTWRKAGLLALALAFAAPAATPSFAAERWQHRGGWGGGHAWHGGGWVGGCGGCGVGGALLGLGVGVAVGAAVAGAYAPPPVYYAPPPPVYYGY